MNNRLPLLNFFTVYNKRGDTLKHLMPGQALALQGFPGIVCIKRGGIHRAPGIVNDAGHDFVSVLRIFRLVKTKFDDNLFICG